MKFYRLDSLTSSSDVNTIFGNFSAQKLGYIKILMDTIYGYSVQTVLRPNIADARQISYILATVQHETANFTTLYEIPGAGDPVIYFNNKYGNRTDLGNRPGTNDGYDYRGRGFVQITGRDNYIRVGNLLGIDLVNNPNLAADPQIAAEIAVFGMVNGWFTGAKLDTYINDTKTDYIGARRIINSENPNTSSIPSTVASYTMTFDTSLESNLYKTHTSFTIDATKETDSVTLTGGLSDDHLLGGKGTDTLYGGTGDDILDGGDGTDTASYKDSNIDIKVKIEEQATTPSSAVSGKDIISNIEKIQGSDYQDRMDITLLANSKVTEIDSGAKDDIVHVTAGSDLPNLVIKLGDGDDKITNVPNGATVYGGAGQDVFFVPLPMGIGDTASILNYTIADAGPEDRLFTGSVDNGKDNGWLLGGPTNLVGDSVWRIYNFSDPGYIQMKGNDLALIYGSVGTYREITIKNFHNGDLGLFISGTPPANDGADNITDAPGPSSVNTGYGNDTVTLNTGPNTVTLGHGDDITIAGVDADTIYGGPGFDTVSYSASNAAVDVNLSLNTASGGYAQGDVLSLIENVTGSAYSDTLTAAIWGSILDGGAGNDILTGGDGNDTLIGGAGNDSMDGGNGSDTVSYAASSVVIQVNLNNVGQDWGAYGDSLYNIENLIGSSFGDIITAKSSGSIINGGDGGDTIYGAAGNDTLYGDNGDDTFYAGDGDDAIYGGAGNDAIYSNGGNNLIIGGAGADVMNGFGGTATASYAGSYPGININLSTNVNTGGYAQGDTLYGVPNIIGTDYNDTIIGDGFANILSGGKGNDLLSGMGYGGNTLDGGDGVDTVSYSYASSVYVDLNVTTSQGWAASGDIVLDVENLIGSSYDDNLSAKTSGSSISAGDGWDTVSGAAGNDILHGDAGNDTIYGWDGNDTIYGDTGDDTIYGQGGTNILIGGAGADYMSGFGGNSTVSYATSGAAVSVNMNTNTYSGGDAQGDNMGGITGLIGSAFADTLVGNYMDNIINGGAGADTIDGFTGNDTVSYATSSAGVTVNLGITTAQSGGDAAGDLLTSIENVTGSTFNDTFTATATGNNILTGGGGNDSYVFGSTFGQATIKNISATSTSANGSVSFGSGITDEKLWFEQVGNDLRVDLLGTTKTITIADWYGSNASAQVASFNTSDGLKLDGQVAQLVSAMASYKAAHAGFNPQTASAMPTDATLQAAIAASWHS